MAMTPSRRYFSDTRYNPAQMESIGLDSVPEEWRQAIWIAQPNVGVNLFSINGEMTSNWVFQAQGEQALSLSILLHGKMESAIDDGRDLSLQAGYLLVMGVGDTVRGWNVFSGNKQFRLLNIHLSSQAVYGLTGTSVDDILNGMRENRLGEPHQDLCMATLPISSQLQRVIGEIEHYQGRYHGYLAKNAFVCAKVAEAIATVLDRCCDTGNAALTRALPFDRLKLVKARNLLENNYQESWTVASLSEQVGLNEKRLQAGFKVMYGYTVHDYLTNIRIDMAMSLLACGYSVTRVAYECGFADINHFSKVFRQRIGVSPKQWIKGNV